MADEYDAAQERGEVAKRGWESGVDKDNITTAADLGLRRDEIHEARKLRDAEAAQPTGGVLSVLPVLPGGVETRTPPNGGTSATLFPSALDRSRIMRDLRLGPENPIQGKP